MLEHVWKQTGKKPKTLQDHVPPPEELAYLWTLYCEMRQIIPVEENLSLKHFAEWGRCFGPLEFWECQALSMIERQRITPRHERKTSHE